MRIFLPIWAAPMAAVLCVACAGGSSAAPAKTRPPPMVVVTKPVIRDVPVEVHAPVDLRPLLQVDVGSKVLGYVAAVFVDRGDRVHKGQLVALVRPSDLPDQLAVAGGVLAQTQSSAALAQANRDRARALAPTGVMSQQELQQAEATLASAQAAQAAAQAQIGALGVRLGETKIESPLDGVVSVRRLDPGALVGPPGGGAIITVVRVDRLRVFVTTNETDALRITVGKDAHVEVDSVPGRSFSGKVVRVAPTFDPGTRTLEAEVQLDNGDGELRPGMYGYGSIVLDVHPHAVVLPAAAVQITAEQKYVFVLTGATVTKRAVETGVDAGPWLEITSGVNPSDEIVVAGADGLADGAKVRVVRDVNPYTGLNAKLGAPVGSGSNATRKD